LSDPSLTVTLHKLVGSLKRGEKSKVEVNPKFIVNHDPALLEMLQKQVDRF
jgi:hypothetical protein